MQDAVIFDIRPLTGADRPWVRKMIVERWGAEIVIAHGEIFHPADLPGFIAWESGIAVGLITYNFSERGCEIVTIDSWAEGRGAGTRLIESVREAVVQRNCQRVWLVTTNDNIHALGFYQKRGFVICAVRLDVFEKYRLLKPQIPLYGGSGIPIRDEIEFELKL